MTIGPCETCEFMFPKAGAVLGTKCDGWCHRYPPVAVGGGLAFPLIRNINDPGNACGEYVKDAKKTPVKSATK